jgi:hypothetical protein
MVFCTSRFLLVKTDNEFKFLMHTDIIQLFQLLHDQIWPRPFGFPGTIFLLWHSQVVRYATKSHKKLNKSHNFNNLDIKLRFQLLCTFVIDLPVPKLVRYCNFCRYELCVTLPCSVMHTHFSATQTIHNHLNQ